jgi:hypothetical protein
MFSVFAQAQTQKTVSGVTGSSVKEQQKNSSFSMFKGWTYDCKKQEWRYEFFISAMAQQNGTEQSLNGTQEISKEYYPCDQKKK